MDGNGDLPLILHSATGISFNIPPEVSIRWTDSPRTSSSRPMCASVPGSSAETSGVTVAAAKAREIIPAAASTQATRCGEDVAASLPSAVAKLDCRGACRSRRSARDLAS